jgi:hypothetical protein
VTAVTSADRPAEGMPGYEKAFAHLWWILSVVGVAQLTVVVDVAIVNIALPSAQQALGFSGANRQWGRPRAAGA